MIVAKRYVGIEKSLGKDLALTDARTDINRACQGKKINSVRSRINQDPQPTDKSHEAHNNKQKTQTNHETPAIQSGAQREYKMVL